jgi:hypothetical protein
MTSQVVERGPRGGPRVGGEAESGAAWDGGAPGDIIGGTFTQGGPRIGFTSAGEAWTVTPAVVKGRRTDRAGTLIFVMRGAETRQFGRPVSERPCGWIWSHSRLA